MNLKYWLAKAMQQYGGRFVQCLGECILQADDENYHKILTTWPEYCAKYTTFALQLKQEDELKP